MINHVNYNNSQLSMRRDNNQFALLFNGFIFGKKNEKINWRKIAAVDVDRIAREVDVDVLQDNIEQITFCSIESEIDSRLIDPNFIKLFKMSQLTIEYLLECQRQLVEYISNNKSQVDESYLELNELKKINDLLQKELTELKKENKRRKKIIELQQNMINSNSTNYHRCAYCSKAFLNVTYLQGHISRRHSQMSQITTQQIPQQQNKISPEIELELEKIKDKLRETENQLIQERNNRYNSNSIDSSKDIKFFKQFEEWKDTQKKFHMEEMKAMEEKFLKEIDDLRMKNLYSEKALNDFEQKLGKKSNIGNLEDETEEELKKNKIEFNKLKKQLELNKNEYEEKNSKWKNKIEKNKEKYIKELHEKEALIKKLTDQLNSKKKVVKNHEIEDEIQPPPPPIPPRSARSPSPTKSIIPQTILQSNLSSRSSIGLDMYLPEYCPLTKNALKNEPNIISLYKETVRKIFEAQLDDIGIHPNEKGLSENDFKDKMNSLEYYRKDIDNNTKPLFNQMRKTFSEICNEHLKKRLTSSVKSSNEFRVKFEKDPIRYDYKQNKRPNIGANKLLDSYSNHDKSSSEISEESVPNGLESNDDDTEPTKPFSNQIINSVLNNNKNNNANFLNNNNNNNNNNNKITDIKNNNINSTKALNQQHNYYDNEEDISDIELTDNKSQQVEKKNTNIISNVIINNHSGAMVKKNKELIEKQLEDIKKKGIKPSKNAIPTAFNNNNNKYDDVSDVSVSPLDVTEDEKMALKNKNIQNQPSLDTSTNTSIWASGSHGGHLNGRNSANFNKHDNDRPPTANSVQTSNYDSDDYIE